MQSCAARADKVRTSRPIWLRSQKDLAGVAAIGLEALDDPWKIIGHWTRRRRKTMSQVLKQAEKLQAALRNMVVPSVGWFLRKAAAGH